MLRQRLYIDTSVFGGYFDDEFSDHTKPLFERLFQEEFIMLFSALTEEELAQAPLRVQELVIALKSELVELLPISEEVIELANAYVHEKVIGKINYADCLHIALATIHRADFLISWNFKHIVNVQRIRGYNSVNIKYGYKELEIRSPREFERYEDE